VRRARRKPSRGVRLRVLVPPPLRPAGVHDEKRVVCKAAPPLPLAVLLALMTISDRSGSGCAVVLVTSLLHQRPCRRELGLAGRLVARRTVACTLPLWRHRPDASPPLLRSHATKPRHFRWPLLFTISISRMLLILRGRPCRRGAAIHRSMLEWMNAQRALSAVLVVEQRQSPPSPRGRGGVR
jgi:hypothetical protein